MILSWCGALALFVASCDADQGAPTGAASSANATVSTPEEALAVLVTAARPITVAEATQAEAMFRAAMAADPKDMRWPAGIAMLTRYKDGITDGVALARHAVEADPTGANGWFGLGIALINDRADNTADKIQRSRAAIDAIERAIACDPSHPGALGMAAEYYISVPPSAGGNRDRAILLTDRMMTMESVRCRGAELRARMSLIDKDWAGVDEWYDKGIAWAPNPDVARELHRQHAVLYLTFAKDYHRAIELATPFATPGAPDAHRFSFIIGQAAYRLGDCDTAITQYQRVVDSGEPLPVVLTELADCQEKRGDIAGAIRSLELFATTFKGNPNEEQVLISLNRLKARANTQSGSPKAP